MPVYALGDRIPVIDPSAFVHPDAVIIGDVRIGPESSIWPTAVLRGDYGAIRIGAQTSIQDGTIIHCTAEHDTVVGDRCVVGHNVHLEGCTVLDDSLIGSGSVVLHAVTIGPHALVGASALVPGGMTVPRNARALGVPAKVTEQAIPDNAFAEAVAIYVHNSHWYNADLRKIS
jgi:carbonic anhydrase/acetyltransferase-like protein (isoleucine patch superfamily)